VQLLHQRGDLSVADYVTAIRQQEATLRIKSSENTSSNLTSTSGSALVSNVQAGNSQYNNNRNSSSRGRFRGRGGYRGNRSHISRSQVTCHHCGKIGHTQRDCFSRQQTPQTTKNCFHCGKTGHVRNDCYVRERGTKAREYHLKKRNNTENTPSATPAIADLENVPIQALVVAASTQPQTNALMNSEDCLSPSWVIDSGATHHLCRERDAFHGYQRLSKPITIHMGNDSSVPAIGKGNIRVHLTSNGQIFGLNLEALHVPKLRMSLLSVGQLSAKYDLSFTRNSCLIANQQGIKILLGELKGNFWQLNGAGRVIIPGAMVKAPLIQTSKPTNHVTAITALTSAHTYSNPESTNSTSATIPSTSTSPLPDVSINVWHRRLGHLHHRAVATLTGLSVSNNLSPCQVCIQSKHQRQFTRTPVERAARPFELIHSDLCGPISTPSCSGSRYLLLYIDDYSRWAYGFFLRSKESTEITSIFQEFQARIETAYPKWPIARFRCDNARGEYDNSLFRGVLRVGGISFEPAPPYTQHKNGVSERMIRTVVTKGRSMLLDSGLPDEMWAEALETALYLQARSPSSALEGRSPYEVLHGEKPPIYHLRRFGCSASRLIPKEQREGKFGPRSRECVFLGYVHNTTKIWRVWDPVFRRVVSSSDIIFDESRTPALFKRPSSDSLKDLISNPRFDDADIEYLDDVVKTSITMKPSMLPGAGKDLSFNSVPPPNAVLQVPDSTSTPVSPHVAVDFRPVEKVIESSTVDVSHKSVMSLLV
jgi:hypothetical protein